MKDHSDIYIMKVSLSLPSSLTLSLSLLDLLAETLF